MAHFEPARVGHSALAGLPQHAHNKHAYFFTFPKMPDSKHPDRGIGFLMADISRLLRRDFDRRVRDLDITQAQWRALAHLARDEGINQAALAERLEVQPITIARLIDRMEAAGWVRRESDTSDRRASLLFLTPKAKPIIDELHARADGAVEALLRGISLRARREVKATLEHMKANLIAAEAATDAAAPKGKKDHVRRKTSAG
jgi:DNA-binding MarR family transcriptional regulator